MGTLVSLREPGVGLGIVHDHHVLEVHDVVRLQRFGDAFRAGEIEAAPAVNRDVHPVPHAVANFPNPSHAAVKRLVAEVIVASLKWIDLHGGGAAVEQEAHDLHRVTAHLHFVYGPVIGCRVVNPNTVPRLAAEQPVQRQPGRLAQGIQLRHIDGAQNAHVRAARVAHGHVFIERPPDAVDVARVASEQQPRIVLAVRRSAHN